MPDDTPQPGLLDKKQVASRLMVSTGTIDNLVLAGKFPKPLKVGNAPRWLESDLTEYIRWLDYQRKMESTNTGQMDPN